MKTGDLQEHLHLIHLFRARNKFCDSSSAVGYPILFRRVLGQGCVEIYIYHSVALGLALNVR